MNRWGKIFLVYFLSTMVSAALPAVVFAYFSDLGVDFYVLALVYYPFSFAAVLLIGTPAYIFFVELRWNIYLSAICYGSLAGAMLAATLNSFEINYLSMLVCIVTGMLTALIYSSIQIRAEVL